MGARRAAGGRGGGGGVGAGPAGPGGRREREIEIEIRFIDSGYSPINHQLPKSLQYQSLLN